MAATRSCRVDEWRRRENHSQNNHFIKFICKYKYNMYKHIIQIQIQIERRMANCGARDNLNIAIYDFYLQIQLLNKYKYGTNRIGTESGLKPRRGLQ